MSDEQRPDERPAAPRDPVVFARDVARELEHIAEKGVLRTPAGELRCSAHAQKAAKEAAPRWWLEAERRAVHAQRIVPT